MRGLIAALAVAATSAAAQDEPPVWALLRAYGCGSCHRIDGVPFARGNTGPPLTRMGEQLYVAGVVPNTRDHLIAFIRDPQEIDPRSAMPDLGVTPDEAALIADYLTRAE